jgi:hypothetical protein
MEVLRCNRGEGLSLTGGPGKIGAVKSKTLITTGMEAGNVEDGKSEDRKKKGE